MTPPSRTDPLDEGGRRPTDASTWRSTWWCSRVYSLRASSSKALRITFGGAAERHHGLTFMTDHQKVDLVWWISLLALAGCGISMNLLTFRPPTHIFRTDACEHGIGRYGLENGRAWRWELRVEIRLHIGCASPTSRPSSHSNGGVPGALLYCSWNMAASSTASGSRATTTTLQTVSLAIIIYPLNVSPNCYCYRRSLRCRVPHPALPGRPIMQTYRRRGSGLSV
jgi:hypothetical protein